MRLSALVALAGLSTFLTACDTDSASPTAREAGTPSSSYVAGLPGGRVDFCLTLLHNNDGETQLLGAPGQPLYGSAARFVTLVRELRTQAEQGAGGAARFASCDDRPGLGKRAAVTVSSGDNWLAGAQFNASLESGTFYDAGVLSAIGYDAITIGNHEFDFGPALLAKLIEQYTGAGPWISANLDVSAEPGLASLARRGRIAKSVIVEKRGELIGVVGATTPLLPSISSPGRVLASSAVASAIQAEIDAMRGRGVNKFIVSSHLQSLSEDVALIPQLRHVDIFIAGGGSDLLLNPTKGAQGTPLVPGDAARSAFPTDYPTVVRDADNRPVLLVTTEGNYKYVGRLIVGFDKDGEVVSVGKESGPVRVADASLPGGVLKDPQVEATVEQPVAAYTEALAQRVLAQSEVPLDARTSVIRVREATVGNLFADALLFAGRQRAAAFSVPAPQVAFQNAGGIRSNALYPAGAISELTTFSLAAFSNFVAVVPNVDRTQFKALLEHGLARTPIADGRFPQVAGMRIEYRTANAAGSRVVRVTLDDGTVVVDAGAVVPGAPISLVTNDFTARGGDAYPFNGIPFTTIGVTYQQALANWLSNSAALGGTLTLARYSNLSVTDADLASFGQAAPPIAAPTRLIPLP